MKSSILTLLGTVAVAAVVSTTMMVKGQSGAALQRCEVAIIKWDGPDKLQLITPQKTEYLRLFQTGVPCPRDIHDEEFCMVWAANKLAQDGWEPVNLNATRMLLKRAVAR